MRRIVALMHVEVWSDVVCPWCYIGKRRFEHALADLPRRDEVQVVFRPYQLDPSAPPGTTMPVLEAYARKFGGEERARRIIDHVTAVAADSGLHFRLDRARRANTFDAHRLLWMAGRRGVQAEVKERLLQAYFVEGLDVGDPDVLVGVAAASGLDDGEIRRGLERDDGAEEVRADLARAAASDIMAVPTFVIEGQWAIPGAQEPETFRIVLERAFERLVHHGGG
jgi:predicted DsbA family dithiol-disulfide isomerase